MISGSFALHTASPTVFLMPRYKLVNYMELVQIRLAFVNVSTTAPLHQLTPHLNPYVNVEFFLCSFSASTDERIARQLRCSTAILALTSTTMILEQH